MLGMKSKLACSIIVVLGLAAACKPTDNPLPPQFNRNLAATPGPAYTPNGKLMPMDAVGDTSIMYLQDQTQPNLKRSAGSVQGTTAGAPVAPAGTEAATTAPANPSPASAPAVP